MALEAGDAVRGTGLAGAIAASRREAWGKSYRVEKDAPALNKEAAAIINYIVANAEVSVTEAPGGSVLDPPGIGVIT